MQIRLAAFPKSWVAGSGCLVLLFGASGFAQPDGFRPSAWAQLMSMADLPDLEPDPANRYGDDPVAARFGQMLFYDPRIGGPLQVASDLGNIGDLGRVACTACHDTDRAFIDTRSVPNHVSVAVNIQRRNAPSLLNVAHYRWHGVAGQQDGLATQAATTHESRINTDGSRLGLAHHLWTFYRAEYNAIFDEPLPEELDPSHPEADRFPAWGRPTRGTEPPNAWADMTQEDRDTVNRIISNQGKAIAAYFRRLVSRNAAFDRYMAGDLEAISESAKRGAGVFVGAAYCCECHKGPFFTDQGFHNLGVPQVGEHVPVPPEWDKGRERDIMTAFNHQFARFKDNGFSDAPEVGLEKWSGLLDESGKPIVTEVDRGAFRTPTLRNVARTAPYFHNGSAKTLREVIEFYNDGGGEDTTLFLGSKSPSIVPLGLLENEIDDLVAFLETLNGETLPLDLRRNPAVPRLLGVVHGLDDANAASGPADTFVSPLADRPQTALREVEMDLVIASELVAAEVEFTGDPTGAPTVDEVVSMGDGRHAVRLDPPVEPGQWAKITLRLRSIGPQLEGTVVIWVAHHPGDINRDGVMNMADATAFGEAFRRGADPFLLDLNGDGRVDVRDATEFGHNFQGTGGVPVAWEGHQLPPKPE